MQFRKKSPALPPANTVLIHEPPSFADLNEREALFVSEFVARSGTSGAGAEAALAAEDRAALPYHFRYCRWMDGWGPRGP